MDYYWVPVAGGGQPITMTLYIVVGAVIAVFTVVVVFLYIRMRKKKDPDANAPKDGAHKG